MSAQPRSVLCTSNKSETINPIQSQSQSQSVWCCCRSCCAPLCCALPASPTAAGTPTCCRSFREPNRCACACAFRRGRLSRSGGLVKVVSRCPNGVLTTVTGVSPALLIAHVYGDAKTRGAAYGTLVKPYLKTVLQVRMVWRLDGWYSDVAPLPHSSSGFGSTRMWPSSCTASLSPLSVCECVRGPLAHAS